MTGPDDNTHTDDEIQEPTYQEEEATEEVHGDQIELYQNRLDDAIAGVTDSEEEES